MNFGTRSCPKCLNSRNDHRFPAEISYYFKQDDNGTITQEWLLITCARCGADWVEPTADKGGEHAAKEKETERRSRTGPDATDLDLGG